MYDQGSTIGSNSSKISPSVYTPRPGIDTNTLNTKSYNSLMKMLLNKEQEIYKMTGVMNQGAGVKSNSSTPNSHSKNINSSRVRRVDLENVMKQASDPKNFKQSEIKPMAGHMNSAKELEEYLRLNNASRNYLSHASNSVLQSKTYR